MKRWACPREMNRASCVCGVAMREDETILIADMCVNETAITGRSPSYYTYNAKNLPQDAGITVSDAGNAFKVRKQYFIPIRQGSKSAALYCN